MDHRLSEEFLPRRNAGIPENVRDRMPLQIQAEMNQCKALHRSQICRICLPAWLEDHPLDPTIDMEQVYADQTESEAEAEARLTEDDGEWKTDGGPISAASSFN